MIAHTSATAFVIKLCLVSVLARDSRYTYLYIADDNNFRKVLWLRAQATSNTLLVMWVHPTNTNTITTFTTVSTYSHTV